MTATQPQHLHSSAPGGCALLCACESVALLALGNKSKKPLLT